MLLKVQFEINRCRWVVGEINVPVLKDLPDIEPLIGLQNVQGLPVIDWIKMAHDGSGDLAVRVYEANGQSTSASLPTNGPMVAGSGP